MNNLAAIFGIGTLWLAASSGVIGDAGNTPGELPGRVPHRADLPAPTATLAGATATMPALPPAPAGVADFDLRRLFQSPVGAYGLEYDRQARALDGHRVRVRGHIVSHEKESARVALFCVRPVSVHDHEGGFCDDLPASTMHLILPDANHTLTPLTGEVVLLGTLQLGSREEADGRRSLARLVVTEADLEAMQFVKDFSRATNCLDTASQSVPAKVAPADTQPALIKP